MQVITHIARTVDELDTIANALLNDFKDERIFAFEGKMGAGKTTMIKAFCQAMGVKDVVSSPTFSLVNVYNDQYGNNVYHFDFYRIKKLEEVYDIGYEEYFYSGNYCLIEWPGMVNEILPNEYIEVSIEANENEQRHISYLKIRK